MLGNDGKLAVIDGGALVSDVDDKGKFPERKALINASLSKSNLSQSA
jgi:hypothetical protein